MLISRRTAVVAVLLLAAGGAGPVATASPVTAPATLPPTSHPAARASAAPAIRNPIAFSDTFDNGRRDAWTVASETRAHGPAKWQVKDGSLRQTGNVFAGSGASAQGTNIVAGNPAWRDYDFGVTVRSLDDDKLGVVFRYVDRDNFYRFSIDRQRNVRQLIAKVHGHYRVLAQSRGRYTKNRLYRLQVRAVGSDLRASIDGRQVLAAHDSHLSHGRFGMFTWADSARFDTVRAAVGGQQSFTVAVLPDTQYESESAPSMFRAETRWLARNRAGRNLVAVLHEGDVVNRLERPQQWRNARAALNYLAGTVPLTVAAGNHDNEIQHSKRPRTEHPAAFNKLLGSLPDYRVDGRYSRNDLRNTYQLLDTGGVRFAIVNLTYGPTDKELAWAGRVADRYRDRHVVLLTHDYLGEDNKVRGPGDRDLPSHSAPFHNNGIDIWRKFVRKHANVQFTFNGHVIGKTRRSADYSVGRLRSTDAAGRSVYQTLTNYQIRSRGQGYLRLARFTPSQHRVDLETYSPYLHRTLPGPDNRFAYTGVDLRTW